MKLTATLLLGVISLYQSIAQTTIHGIDPNWYQNPKAAVTSATYNLKGAEANCVVVKSDGTVVIFYKQGGQNKWIQSSDGGNTWTSPGSLPVRLPMGYQQLLQTLIRMTIFI